jgi:hypothetical protein
MHGDFLFVILSEAKDPQMFRFAQHDKFKPEIPSSAGMKNP